MAAGLGVEVRRPRVLSDRSNLLVRLAPAPVVARVATSTGAVRAAGAFDWLARDVALAGFLASQGAAVVPPATELPPGPHVEDGLAMTFWRFVEHDPEHPPTPDESGAALRRLHEALEDFLGELPPFGTVLDECVVVIERLAAAGSLDPPGPAPDALHSTLTRVRSAIERAARPPRPLHGDATRSNLLRTPAGLLWTDFEDTCSAPAEWDLACLVSSMEPAAEGALEAYGGQPEALEPFVEARRLQGALWTALVVERHPELRARAASRLSRWAV